MFTRSKDLQDLKEIADKAQALVRQQLIRDFIAHLEDEYRLAMTRVEEAERPSILVWLGQVGGYYAMIQDRYASIAQLAGVCSAITGIFEWEDFVAHLDAALNDKYSQKTPDRLTVGPAARGEEGFSLNMEILTFSYDPHYAWGD
jgi:hypothetical protein